MKQPRSVYNYILLFCIFLLAGILFANIVFVMMAAVPFLLIMAGHMLKLPDGVSAERNLSKEVLYTGDVLTVGIEINIKSGVGFVTLSDVIPKGFQLERGSNLSVVWKGFGERKLNMTYSLKCLSAGEFEFGDILWESRHFLYGYTVQDSIRQEQIIEVTPQLFAPNRSKGISGASRIPMPLHAISRIGIPTLDFKEIRLYGYGDSFKFINWKASSRSVFRGDFWPVINEYEKEGKRTVWIFLDGARTMDYGTSIKSLFDYGVEAACQLSDYYIRQQCSTALCTYNEAGIFISPGMGKKHYYKILGEVMELCYLKRVSEGNYVRKSRSLEETLMEHRYHIAGSKPLFIIITHGCEENHSELAKGLREMSKYSMEARKLLQIMVINIKDGSITSEKESDKLASEILDIKYSGFMEALKKRCIWVDWDPLKANLFDAILKRVV